MVAWELRVSSFFFINEIKVVGKTVFPIHWEQPGGKSDFPLRSHCAHALLAGEVLSLSPIPRLLRTEYHLLDRPPAGSTISVFRPYVNWCGAFPHTVSIQAHYYSHWPCAQLMGDLHKNSLIALLVTSHQAFSRDKLGRLVQVARQYEPLMFPLSFISYDSASGIFCVD